MAGSRSESSVALPGSMGAALRKARRAKGWTQQKLESTSGVSQPQISIIERGNNKDTTADTLLRLADALKLEPGPLWHGRIVHRGEKVDELSIDAARLDLKLDGPNRAKWIAYGQGLLDGQTDEALRTLPSTVVGFKKRAGK